MRHFSKKDDLFLLSNYKTIPAKTMSRMLDRSESCARQRMRLLGIVVPPEILEKFRAIGRYKKGRVPENKGKKMSKALYDKVRPTMFQKGSVPANHKPVGAIRVTKDGYQEIKVAEPNKWEAYHRVMWEETFGVIPKNGVVRFVTKDKMNVHPFNLELIDRSRNMKLNSYHNYGPEVAKTIQLIGALNRQINKNEKHSGSTRNPI